MSSCNNESKRRADTSCVDHESDRGSSGNNQMAIFVTRVSTSTLENNNEAHQYRDDHEKEKNLKILREVICQCRSITKSRPSAKEIRERLESHIWRSDKKRRREEEKRNIHSIQWVDRPSIPIHRLEGRLFDSHFTVSCLESISLIRLTNSLLTLAIRIKNQKPAAQTNP